MIMKQRTCALILGGYVNGYSILQELYDNGIRDIVLFSTKVEPARYSNKIKKFVLIDPTPGALLKELLALSAEYSYIVPFPTDDLHLENLFFLCSRISDFCFLPFNKNNFPAMLDKYTQYNYCDALGVPHPKTQKIHTVTDIDAVTEMTYPVLIKPTTRMDEKISIFRNLHLHNDEDLKTHTESLKKFVMSGISFIASEVIPGPGSNIYAYVGYRNNKGRILNEWGGKKLSQYPDDFGVFSSASNTAPEVVLQQGRTLLNGMNLMGIAEPEFKYDARDGNYKLMEINLRSMMWNRVGYLAGVKIHYTQYMDATGGEVPVCRQDTAHDIHLVYLKHEILNLISRKKYFPVFYGNLFGGERTSACFFDKHDLVPFIFDGIQIIDNVLETYLKRFGRERHIPVP